jgi:two-component system, OmpR family, sensor histidine kinase MtrB
MLSPRPHKTDRNTRPKPPPARLSPRRLGLRARITISFALGALLLSIVMATITYLVARQTLIRQRENTLVRQAYVNANSLKDNLTARDPNLIDLLSSLRNSSDTSALVRLEDQEVALNPTPRGFDTIPAALKNRVYEAAVPQLMRTKIGNTPVFIIGIALPLDGSYFEITNLTELARTLRSLRIVLVGAAGLTTLLGAVLGVWSSRLTTRPLGQAARAAEAIAGGRLDTRLESVDDRDLAVLTSAFNDMAAALEQRVERDARFASDVSHELRSPLMTLAASAEVLESRREELSERSAAALDLLVADVKRFQGLVEDLLEISRFDAGQVRLNFEEVLISQFVPLAVRIVDSDVPVVVHPGAENVIVRVDKRRLARVVANLLENARFYAGGASMVNVTVRHGEPLVDVSVEDNGLGVPVEERSLIFERFARGTGAGNRSVSEGAGLGLALVAEHVRLHHGRVWVEDKPDGTPGARFVMELPIELEVLQ